MSDQKSSSWPKFVWGLFALSLLLSCAVLVCLGWFGLTGSGFTSNFPIWLPGVAVSTYKVIIIAILGDVSNSPVDLIGVLDTLLYYHQYILQQSVCLRDPPPRLHPGRDLGWRHHQNGSFYFQHRSARELRPSVFDS